MTPTRPCSKQSTSRQQRRLALLAGEELSGTRRRRLEAHLAGCVACTRLLADLRGLRRLAAGSLAEEADNGFRSVRAAVRRQVRTARTPASSRPLRVVTPLWSTWAPAAGVLAVAGLLLMGWGGDHRRVAGDTVARLAADQITLHLSSMKDGHSARLTVAGPVTGVRRVAVSSVSSDFNGARVFEFDGRSWTDPMPEPPAGAAFFYRVD
ncbi:MAG: anti-sigma factor family protein [Acidobacteriota bacterium]